MKKEYLYQKNENKLCICVPFTQNHIQALFQVFANDGCAEFENRDPNLCEDVDGNSISWQICDELVEMGLLWEDEESFDVYFEITEQGTELLKQLT
jgi:hypothetical protein